MNSDWYAHDFRLQNMKWLFSLAKKEGLYFNISTLVNNETLVKLLVGAFLSFQVHSQQNLLAN